MLGDNETIAAIGTAKGVGALGIIRVSGLHTPEILARCFASKQFKVQESHTASFGVWKNPRTQEPVDEVVVVNFTQGRGYTGEAAADIICHGGVQVTELVLNATLDAGARLARPGEFTYRAVMNGRLDLSQAESVLEIISAKSPRAAALALKNIQGALSEKATHIEAELIYLLANLEASIDFTTEDIQPVSLVEMNQRLEKSLDITKQLLKSYVSTQVVTSGLRMAIIGKPNVGKSSLMNSLLGKKRSIVADLPGTTRDTIEAEFSLDGYLFKAIDTAGLRQSDNSIEKEGIQRSLDEMTSSDLVLYIADATVGLQNEDIEHLKNIGSKNAIICFNKADLKGLEISQELEKSGLLEFPTVKTSAVTENGIDELKNKLLSLIHQSSNSEMNSVVSTQRQKEALEGALTHMSKASSLMRENASPEFIAFELKEALLKTQSLLGKNVGDDVMDQVFKQFCIGK
ncbi:MAG: tRNA uridine-5-carboxymethylaminomethyl(34) synthesis GTPase MnmE [Oligoflexia bacterium]|nr:tRNA uridine-5-carboxymethylaminomethyl(34) synthesis GTPase MnmE [Oligoflexia bacterium]